MLEVGRFQVPETLREVLRPSSTALLIIDMQNDFVAVGGAMDKAGGDIAPLRAIIAPVAKVAETCRDLGIPVVHIRLLTLPNGASDSVGSLRFKLRVNRNYDSHRATPLEYTLEGTWGAEFIDELQPLQEDIVIEKLRSSALFDTPLDMMLRARRITSVLVAGCTTEGCVEATVRDLSSHDYIPVVIRDCVASDHADLHTAALTVMGGYGAEVTESREVRDILEVTSKEERDSRDG